MKQSPLVVVGGGGLSLKWEIRDGWPKDSNLLLRGRNKCCTIQLVIGLYYLVVRRRQYYVNQGPNAVRIVRNLPVGRNSALLPRVETSRKIRQRGFALSRGVVKK